MRNSSSYIFPTFQWKTAYDPTTMICVSTVFKVIIIFSITAVKNTEVYGGSNWAIIYMYGCMVQHLRLIFPTGNRSHKPSS